MNMTSVTGVVIALMIFTLGLHAREPMLVVLAFAAVGLGYVLNVMDEMQLGSPMRSWLYYADVAVGVMAYVYILANITRLL